MKYLKRISVLLLLIVILNFTLRIILPSIPGGGDCVAREDSQKYQEWKIQHPEQKYGLPPLSVMDCTSQEDYKYPLAEILSAIISSIVLFILTVKGKI